MSLNNRIALFVSSLALLLQASSVKAEDLVIALEAAGVRAAPQFFAAVQTTLPYGTRVKVIETKGAWAKIGSGTTTGWMHQSAFAKAAPILRDIGKGVSKIKDTYKDEVTTAGKGFTETAEARGIASEPTSAIDVVEQIECRQVPAQQIQKFMKDGGLKSQMVGE